MRSHSSLKSWQELWLSAAAADALLNMRPAPTKNLAVSAVSGDRTALLSDELLLRILSAVTELSIDAVSLVSKRWLRLSGRLRRRLTLMHFPFLLHRRLSSRFPELDYLDLIPASLSPAGDPSTASVLSRGSVSVHVDPYADPPIAKSHFLSPDTLSRGLEVIAETLPNLCKLSLVAPNADDASGLAAVAAGCKTLQELEIHRATDLVLRPISTFENLQILHLIAAVEGLYPPAPDGGGITDIGLTILAHGCKRLVKLEIARCEGSYDGIAAIGRCCMMLEELTITDHRMDAGWVAGLSFCGNLKTLKLQGCRRIDDDPGPFEHLGSCMTLERLHIQRCQLRNWKSMHALFTVCESAREIVLQNCWGLDNEIFASAAICRRVKFLSLEHCSLLTTQGLEEVILSWNDLQRLEVVSCNNIKDEDVSQKLSGLFSNLKELMWRPDARSVLSMSLAGSGMWTKGGRFFKRRILPGQQRLKVKLDEEAS